MVGGRIRAFHSQLQIVEISDKHKITYSLFVINNYCYRIWNCKITYCNLLLFDLINRQCILYTVSSIKIKRNKDSNFQIRSFGQLKPQQYMMIQEVGLNCN